MIKIEVKDKEITAKLKKLQRKTKNLSPVMRVIAGNMWDAVEENFAQQGRPSWKELKPSTILARLRKGHWPGSILQMKGDLARSITTKHTSTSAIVGVNKKQIPYAAILQFGGKAGRGHKANIPARPYFKLTDDDRRKIVDEVEAFLVKS